MATRNSTCRPGPEKAVLYLRMSSAKQDKSIDAQRDELTALAKRKGYSVLREYRDEAISGDDTERRTEFLRLRQDCENGPDFGIILVWDQDRLSRNDPLEIGYWLKPIRDAGVVVETPQGRVDWDTLGGRLIYLISQEMKHDYLRSLSRNVARGQLAAARREKRRGTGGRDPDGYKTKDNRVVVRPDRAAVIRRIFEEYIKPGASLRSVTELLNSEGIKTSRGNQWCLSTVRDVLTNEKYTGSYVRFKYRVGKYHAIQDGEIVSRTKADDWEVVDPVVVEENHKPIIERELFDRVQRKLARQKKQTARRDARQYVLSGLVRCGDCKGIMAGFAHGPSKGTDKTYLVYACRTFHAKGRSACYCNSIGEAPLLDCVRRMLDKHYVSDQAIERLRNRHAAQRQAESRTEVSPVDQRRLRKHIEALDKQIDTGAERVFTAPETIVPKLYAKLEKLRQERDQLQRQLDSVGRTETHSAAEQDQEVEAALDALRTLRTTLQTADPADLRELLSEIVSSIELHYSHRQDGKRTRNTITGGTIWLRPDPALSLLFGTSGN